MFMDFPQGNPDYTTVYVKEHRFFVCSQCSAYVREQLPHTLWHAALREALEKSQVKAMIEDHASTLATKAEQASQDALAAGYSGYIAPGEDGSFVPVELLANEDRRAQIHAEHEAWKAQMQQVNDG